MALHVIFIDEQGQQLSDVTSNFTSVLIPQNAFIMRIADDTKSYSNSTLTKLFEIDNTFYSKVLEYTMKGDYPFIDINVSDFGGFTAIFNQLSAQFIGNNPPSDIYDFTGYGGSSGGNIDFSTIVTALNSIAAALSALTNLSNLSNLSQLANLITAIQSKDNQSSIVGMLDKIFMIKNVSSSKKRSAISGALEDNVYSVNYNNQYFSILGMIHKLLNVFMTYQMEPYDGPNVITNNRKILMPLCCLNTASTSDTQLGNANTSQFSVISSKLQNLETKLEQNLPFTTLAQVDVVTDYTQVVKGVGKNE